MTRVLMDSKQGRLLVHRAQVTDSSQLLSHTTPRGVTEVSSMDNSSRVDTVSKEVRLQLLTGILPAYSRFDLARIFGVAHLQSQDSHIYILKIHPKHWAVVMVEIWISLYCLLLFAA